MLKYAIFVAACTLTVPAAAFEDTLRLDYADDTQLQLGVGVDEADPHSARQFCLATTATDQFYDVGGATTAEVVTSAVFNLEDFENDFKFDYSASTSTSASAAKLFSANTSVTNAGAFELFLKSHQSSMGVFVEANARHGSKRLNYSAGLKPEFQKMLDAGEYDRFRQACGTHFVSSHSLVSQLRVVLNISDLSKRLKSTLSQNWSSTLGGKVSVKALDASSSTSLSSKMSNILTLASRHGTVSYDIKSRGGQGIATVGEVLAGVSMTPDGIAEIFKAIAKAAVGFTRDNAEPDTFNLISFEIFGAKPAALSAGVIDGLEKIYRRIMRLDAAIAVYKGYQTDRPKLYKAYFKPRLDVLKSVRARLIATYKQCRAGGSCDLPTTSELDNLVFLEDVLTGAEFQARCSNGHSFDSQAGQKFLSAADFVIAGKVRFVTDWDSVAVQVFRFEGDTLVRMNFDPVARMRIFNRAGETADVLMQLEAIEVHRASFTKPGGGADLGALAQIRNQFRDRAYLVRIPFNQGFFVDEVVALPNLQRCALVAG